MGLKSFILAFLTLLTSLGTPKPTSNVLISPTPTVKKISFTEMNRLYGPCAYLPVLTYHHIQSLDLAKKKGQTSLTVDTSVFQSQMDYLKTKDYHPISPQDLINFFDFQTPLPSKPILLTFDDAYDDFHLNAAPILKTNSFKSTLFVPTGLVENSGYVSWFDLQSLSTSGLFTFANHTWSHHSLKDELSVIQSEVSEAQTQLIDHGFHQLLFAYPYGTTSLSAINYLSAQKYQLAFTTKHGLIECRAQRLTLPRLHVGNAPLASYGL